MSLFYIYIYIYCYFIPIISIQHIYIDLLLYQLSSPVVILSLYFQFGIVLLLTILFFCLLSTNLMLPLHAPFSTISTVERHQIVVRLFDIYTYIHTFIQYSTFVFKVKIYRHVQIHPLYITIIELIDNLFFF